jgi:hypothetical protein
MEDPSQGLGEGIRWVVGSGNMCQKDISILDPAEEGKVLYVDMPATLIGLPGISHHGSHKVVNI